MKKLFIYLFFFCISCNVSAQKKSVTLVGFNVGISNPKIPALPKYKIGLPSFSYSTSIEKRLMVNNRLNFSFQYALNYFKYSQQNLQDLIAKHTIISNNIGINTNVQLNKNTSVMAGMGVNKRIYENSKIYSNESTIPSIQNKFTIKDFNNLNPYFIVGIENGIQILNKNLFYSLQYNFGFNLNKFKLIPTDNSQRNADYNGFRIGLKYKY